MSRVDQVNETLKMKINDILLRHLALPNALVTIVQVDCSPDLQNARIDISVLPDNMNGSALKALRSLNSTITKELRKSMRLKNIPKFSWQIDEFEKEARSLDKIIDSLS